MMGWMGEARRKVGKREEAGDRVSLPEEGVAEGRTRTRGSCDEIGRVPPVPGSLGTATKKEMGQESEVCCRVVQSLLAGYILSRFSQFARREVQPPRCGY